jgi:hypothetical protein
MVERIIGKGTGGTKRYRARAVMIFPEEKQVEVVKPWDNDC